MIVESKRIFTCDTYTISNVYINKKYFCDILEDADRGITQDTPLKEIQKVKISGKTAIPTGTYTIDMNTVSPKYSQSKYTKQYGNINGKLPRLLNVPGFEGILIHIGNYPEHTEGCLLVGKNTQKGAVLDSTNTFNKLYSILKEASDKKEEIKIIITNNTIR